MMNVLSYSEFEFMAVLANIVQYSPRSAVRRGGRRGRGPKIQRARPGIFSFRRFSRWQLTPTASVAGPKS